MSQGTILDTLIEIDNKTPNSPATAGNQSSLISNLQTLNSLVPTQYDFISLEYTGTDLTTVIYKLGGATGTPVSTLTLAYISSVLQSVTKS